MVELTTPDASRSGRSSSEPRQQRSLLRRQRIVDAAICVIGRDGLSRLTHRSVAAAAKVSLAATTYYYAGRDEIVADASVRLLDRYLEDHRRLLARVASAGDVALADVASRVATGGLGNRSIPTLAWCEVMLDCARHAGAHERARQWYDAIGEIWLDLARAAKLADPERAAISAIDLITGTFFAALPLGLQEGQIDRLFGPSAEQWSDEVSAPNGAASVIGVRSAHGEDTRQRILEAAIALLVKEGPGALTLRKVAQQAGVAAAAPSYHFATAELLLNAAQAALFDGAKERYREATSGAGTIGEGPRHLVDLTYAVFLREVTAYRELALAAYPARLDAARRPELRNMVWHAVTDQNGAWNRRLAAIGIDAPAGAGMLLQCTFLGKLVRVLATRATIGDLSEIHSQFREELEWISLRSHWAQKWYS